MSTCHSFFIHSISLVYTANAIMMSSNVQTIALSPNIIGGAIAAQVSGWGSILLTGGIAPNNLQRLNTTIITNTECRSRHSGENAERIFTNKICTLTRPSEGTCFGDEGGALVVGAQLVAVSSWQIPCATGHPDVYERIAGVRLWILTMTG